MQTCSHANSFNFCAAVVALRESARLQSKTLEVMGSIITECWAFILLFLSLSSLSLIKFPQGDAALLIYLNKKLMLSCAAWGETSIICTDLAQNYVLQDEQRQRSRFSPSCPRLES